MNGNCRNGMIDLLVSTIYIFIKYEVYKFMCLVLPMYCGNDDCGNDDICDDCIYIFYSRQLYIQYVNILSYILY